MEIVTSGWIQQESDTEFVPMRPVTAEEFEELRSDWRSWDAVEFDGIYTSFRRGTDIGFPYSTPFLKKVYVRKDR